MTTGLELSVPSALQHISHEHGCVREEKINFAFAENRAIISLSPSQHCPSS